MNEEIKSTIIRKKQKNCEYGSFETSFISKNIKENVYKELYELRDDVIKKGITRCEGARELMAGDFRGSRKLERNGAESYLFFGANTHHAEPQEILVGTREKGYIWLMGEDFPCNGFISFYKVPEEYVVPDSNVGPKGLRQIEHERYLPEFITKIKDKHVKCFEKAYKGLKEFERFFEKLREDREGEEL